MEEKQIIATVEELRSASRRNAEASLNQDRDERLKEWLQWFDKRGPGLFREAVKRGLWRVCFDLPFQPEDGEVKKGGTFLRGGIWKEIVAGVKEVVPGCEVDIYEEEYENGTKIYVLEVCWIQ